MSNTKNLANLAAALDDGTSGQVLQSTGSGGVQFADSSGSGVTTHTNQAAMISADTSSAYTEGSLHFDLNANVLYVKIGSGAGDGFYAVATVENAAPTITSYSENTGGAGANDLTNATPPNTFTLTAGSNTVITINATEPNLETISYSATVTSGTATDVFSSPSFPVTNQSSNVFTLTPVTSGSGGTVTIRFDASDGTNVGSVSHSFEIAFQITDSNYTTLLMATDDSAGDNSTIVYDTSSTTGNSLTVNGAPYAGSFSPYRSGGFSAYMGGNGNYISTTHATSLKPSGTDDFCVSLWYWPTSNPSTNTQIVGDFRVIVYSHNCNGWDLLHETSGNLAARWAYPNYNDMASGISNNTLNLGEWNHIVFCKNDSTMSLFLNGTRCNARTSNIGMTASTLGSFYIGYAGAASGTTMHSINGYITDFKLDIGGNNAFDATATSITVPTERATLGNNTKLFACHLPYLEDGSTSEHTLSFTGSSTGIKPFAPYDYQAYSESSYGGSLFFNGSSDWLTGPTSLLNFTIADKSTEAATIEAWVYHKGRSSPANAYHNQAILGKGDVYFNMGINGSGNISFYHYDGTARTLTSTGTVPLNEWTHVAATISGGTVTLYINGSAEATTGTWYGIASAGQNQATTIGRASTNASSNYFNGYISDLRVIEGTATAPASGGPTAPLSAVTNTALLLSSIDAHVIDKSQVSNLKLFNDAAAVTNATNNSTISSTNALSLDGTGDYATATITPINTADFTVEAWVWKNAQNATQVICGTRTTSTDTTGFSFVVNSSNELAFYTNTYNAQSSSLNFPAQTWVHVAAVRSGTSLTLYKDGSSVATGTSSHTFSKDVMYIGQNVSTQYWNGYIQDLRVSVGKARTISVPSAPLKG